MEQTTEEGENLIEFPLATE